jgi:hypothetical protein
MEEKNMILFPNQTVTHPDDVYERVQEEFRKDEYEMLLWGYVDEAWDCVDEASRDSFPASDAPPWTLGYIGPSEARSD